MTRSAGFLLAAALLLSHPVGAGMVFHTPDVDLVQRAELIAVGSLRPETIEYVPHQGVGSWEYHAVLVVSHWLKGRREEVEIPIVLQYGVEVRIGQVWQEGFSRLAPAERETLRGRAVEILGERDDLMPWDPLAADASQDQIWFLRTVGEERYGHQPSTGWLGVLDAADVQPLERLSYFQAYLAPDPEAAVAEQARRDPAVAERAREFLADRQIQRLLALPDPRERVAALLPIYAQQEPWASTMKAREGIRKAGAVAGPLLVPLFENPTRPRIKGEVIHLWGEIGYRDAVPRLINLLLEEEAFWAPYHLKPGWWGHFEENGLPATAGTDHYDPLLSSLYALRLLAAPQAREAVERTLRVWSAIPDTTQIADECRMYLRAIGAVESPAAGPDEAVVAGEVDGVDVAVGAGGRTADDGGELVGFDDPHDALGIADGAAAGQERDLPGEAGLQDLGARPRTRIQSDTVSRGPFPSMRAAALHRTRLPRNGVASIFCDTLPKACGSELSPARESSRHLRPPSGFSSTVLTV